MNQIKFPEFKDYTDQTVHYLQSKMDGHLCKIFIDEQRNIQALSKNDKDITAKLLKIKHIAKEIHNLPANTAIFGEMHCSGIFASSVPTLLNQAEERLHLTIFAAPILNGRDMSERDLKSVMDILKTFGIETLETILIPEGRLSEERKEELLQIARDNDSEGWVVKEGHMKGWYKLKPVKTVDAFVTGAQISDSKTCFGGLKSVSLGLWNIHKNEHSPYDLGTCGGGFLKAFRMQFMSQEQIDAEREKFVIAYTNAPIEKFEVFGLPRLDISILIGKVMEVDFDSVTAGGKLRFPRFIRWRDDKDSITCTTEQLQ